MERLTPPLNLGTTTSNVYWLTQTVGFPGRALLNRSMLSDQAESTNSQLKAIRLQISVNVKAAYYGLALARKNIELNDDQRLAYERIWPSPSAAMKPVSAVRSTI